MRSRVLIWKIRSNTATLFGVGIVTCPAIGVVTASRTRKIASSRKLIDYFLSPPSLRLVPSLAFPAPVQVWTRGGSDSREMSPAPEDSPDDSNVDQNANQKSALNGPTADLDSSELGPLGDSNDDAAGSATLSDGSIHGVQNGKIQKRSGLNKVKNKNKRLR